MPKGAEVAAGYLTIENHGNGADKLLSVSTPVAGRVEIHEMMEAGGIMMMRPMKEGSTIPPNGKLVFSPGRSHLMFFELKAPFIEGEQVPVSLDFERAGRIDTSLGVGGIGAEGPQSGAAFEAAGRSTAGQDESFFTHLCGAKVMANVTVSPEGRGPVEVLVQLEDAQENALDAEGLSVTLSNPDSGIAPITISAERIASDTWRARMLVSEAGQWNLALGIAVTPSEEIEIAAPVLVQWSMPKRP